MNNLIKTDPLNLGGKIQDQVGLFCHRMYIPMAIPQDGLRPGQMTLNPQLANVPCHKDGCSLWDGARKMCGDRLLSVCADQIKDELKALNSTIKQLDGWLRISGDK
jgi:hypothetical protein